MAAPSTPPRPADPPAGGRQPGALERAGKARRLLLIATLAVVIGSFLPWVSTAIGNVPGYRGGGLWTFYAAMLGFTGALVPWPRVAVVQAAVLAVVAVVLPLWQVVHLLTLVGTGGWLPGAGLVLVLAGGVAAGVAAWRLGTSAT